MSHDKHRHGRSRRPGSHKVKPRSLVSKLEHLVVEEIEVGGVGGDTQILAPRRSRPGSRKWLPGLRASLGLVGLWLLLIGAALFFRSAWPTDETRFQAIAWEMWQRQAFLVPTLNGEPYLGLPPLLFWLYQAGWTLFGINDWWPRLAPALFGLFGLWLTNPIARQLWPERNEVARYAPFLLLGLPAWAAYTTLALPELLLAACVLLSMLALLRMCRRPGVLSWLLLGVALGLGALSGGLLIFVYVLPVALLAPVWVNSEWRVNAGRWYGDVIKGTVLGLAIFAGWFAPLVEQLGRDRWGELLLAYLMPPRLDWFMADMPWWGYAFFLPLALLPWIAWPLPWLRLWSARQEPLPSGMRFCLTWLVTGVGALMLLPQHQPQWLLPLLPASALIASHLLFDEDWNDYGSDHAIAGMSYPIIVLGGVLTILPKLPYFPLLPTFLWELPPYVGVIIVVVGIALAWMPDASTRARTMNIAIFGILLVVFAQFGLGWKFNEGYRAEALIRFLVEAEKEQRPIAHVGAYQGDFQFAGRLRRTPTVISPAQVGKWARGNRDGFVLTNADIWQPSLDGRDTPVLEATHNGRRLQVWKAWFLGAGG